MRYGILSDIHGHESNLRKAIALLKEHGAQRIACLGDVLGKSGDGVACLDRLFAENALLVVGNHDKIGSSFLPAEAQARLKKAGARSLELDGMVISHYPTCRACEYGCAPWNNKRLDSPEKALSQLVAQQQFISFYGHTHIPALYELRQGAATVCQYDLDMDVPFLLDPASKYCVNPGAITDSKDIEKENPHRRQRALPPPACCTYDVETRVLRFLAIGDKHGC